MHHAAKQLAFKRVDPNVIVRDALWVYQAAHNDAGTAHLAKRPILSNEASDRTAPKPLYRPDQAGEVAANLACGSEPRMVWLPRLRDRWITQVKSATVRYAKRRG